MSAPTGEAAVVMGALELGERGGFRMLRLPDGDLRLERWLPPVDPRSDDPRIARTICIPADSVAWLAKQLLDTTSS